MIVVNYATLINSWAPEEHPYCLPPEMVVLRADNHKVARPSSRLSLLGAHCELHFLHFVITRINLNLLV